MSRLRKQYMLIIFGPTGVGKSDFALQIAQKLPADIINLDMGQMYTPLSIGTAKPDWQSSPVAHHLFDIFDTPKDFTVVAYRNILHDILDQIWKRGKLPILVGGSGFYLKSIFFPPLLRIIEDKELPKYDEKQDLWNLLNKIDPERAAKIDRHDIYRLKRALDIWYTAGEKPSVYIPHFDPPSDFSLLFLTRKREDLYERINARVVEMIDMGWLDEVASLQNTEWEPFLRKKKLIGYVEILEYLYGSRTKEDLKRTIATIQQKTRNYAKRQISFWNMLKKELNNAIKDAQIESKIESVNLTLLDLDLYIKQLSHELLKLLA